MTVDLFVEASRDFEAEHEALRQAEAKVSIAGLWPFLALAESEREFEHRLALAHDRIAQAVPVDLLGSTLAALREDFTDVHAERLREQTENPKVAARGPAQEPAIVPGQQIWHHASQRWVTVTAGMEPDQPDQPSTRHNQFGNPAYFDQAAEEGPHTGQEQYPGYPGFPAGPDPVDPLNSMFPAQPQPWTTNPGAAWVERPMTFGKGGSVTLPAEALSFALGGRYDDEGVETGPGPNPHYFDGGSEGIAGDAQNGFPQDISLPEPDERVDMYGDVPPQQSSGSNEGNSGQYSNPGVQQQATRHTAPGGGEHAPYRIEKVDGGYAVFNDKGERKNEDPKSHEDAREFQKALYKNVPGARESAEEDENKKAAAFHDPTDRRVRVLAQGTPDSMGGTAPVPPPSMMPGGAGSEAMPPMPPGATSTPSAGGPGMGAPGGMANMTDPGGSDAASKAAMPAMGSIASRIVADMVRDRPSDRNPTGVADEYDENNWETPALQRPRQPAEQRGINTPQTPREPIPTASSTPDRYEEEEDMQRQSSVAALAAQTAMGVR